MYEIYAKHVGAEIIRTSSQEHNLEEFYELYKKESPDIIVVEGQGALSHPAFTSSSAILRGAMPDAIIIQHPPKRKNYCDYPNIPMTTLEEEIKMVEIFSKSKVIAITINHENMTTTEVNDIINTYNINSV